MPMRQRLHWPQPAWISTVTRSPTANSSTPGPSAATVPMYSWPGVQFLLNGSPPLISAGGPRLDDVEVGRADRHRIDAHQHLGPGRNRHRLLGEDQLLRVAQHPGPHLVRHGPTCCGQSSRRQVRTWNLNASASVQALDKHMLPAILGLGPRIAIHERRSRRCGCRTAGHDKPGGRPQTTQPPQRTPSGTGSGALALCRYSTVVNSRSVSPMFSTLCSRYSPLP